jgi:hypothetical protein
MRLRMPLILYLCAAGYTQKIVRKEKRGNGEPPVEVESLANDQERFLSGKKGLSGA